MPAFLCVSREDNRIEYEAQTLEQARGFIEGFDLPCKIVCEIEMVGKTEFLYQIQVIDDQTGQVIVRGPIVDLFEAANAVDFLKIVLMPVCKGVTE